MSEDGEVADSQSVLLQLLEVVKLWPDEQIAHADPFETRLGCSRPRHEPIIVRSALHRQKGGEEAAKGRTLQLEHLPVSLPPQNLLLLPFHTPHRNR